MCIRDRRQVDELMEKIMADVDENTRARQEGRTAAGATLSDYVDYRCLLYTSRCV